jgi:hypothetical protein
MDSGVAGLIGAVIGAASGFLGSLLTSWLTLKKEKEQWLRNKELEQEIWLRDRLQEIYSNCIDYLSRISKASEVSLESGRILPLLSIEHQRELFLDYSEAQKWLGILLVSHPARESNYYDALYQLITSFSNSRVPNLDEANQLRATIINLAARDVRLQGKPAL